MSSRLTDGSRTRSPLNSVSRRVGQSSCSLTLPHQPDRGFGSVNLASRMNHLAGHDIAVPAEEGTPRGGAHIRSPTGGDSVAYPKEHPYLPVAIDAAVRSVPVGCGRPAGRLCAISWLATVGRLIHHDTDRADVPAERAAALKCTSLSRWRRRPYGQFSGTPGRLHERLIARDIDAVRTCGHCRTEGQSRREKIRSLISVTSWCQRRGTERLRLV